MRDITHCLIAFLASSLVATSAVAAPPTAESIDTLLSLSKTQRLLDGIYANIDQVMQQSIAASMQGQPVTPEQQRVIDNMRQKFAVIFREEMSWSKLLPVYTRIYQESFTQEEIDGLIAFYRTPAGNALVEKMPVVMQKSMAAMQPLMAPMMQRMKAATEEAAAEAKQVKQVQQAK